MLANSDRNSAVSSHQQSDASPVTRGLQIPPGATDFPTWWLKLNWVTSTRKPVPVFPSSYLPTPTIPVYSIFIFLFWKITTVPCTYRFPSIIYDTERSLRKYYIYYVNCGSFKMLEHHLWSFYITAGYHIYRRCFKYTSDILKVTFEDARAHWGPISVNRLLASLPIECRQKRKII